MSTADSVLAGDRLALSRLLTQIENNAPEAQTVLDQLFYHTGQAHLVGVTGAPGTGKSSLVNELAKFYRQAPNGGQPVRVAIVAVDPTSPFTGGAILGDRIRMRDLAGDSGIFIRSMASRGALGGLAAATARMVEVFDAAGFGLIFIETVGAGQVEVDIARLAHTTLVIDAPGLGDDVQAIKAGILEIADILVVNKYDRPGGEQTVRALNQMLGLAHPAPKIFRQHAWLAVESDQARVEVPRAVEDSAIEETWIPQVITTIATDGEGVAELARAIDRHHVFLKRTGEGARRDRQRLVAGLESMLRESLVDRWKAGANREKIDGVIERLVGRLISPAEALSILLDGKTPG